MGLAAASKARERRCLVSGEVTEESALVRFALAPDGLVVPDVGAKLPGRGVWVSALRASLDQAVKRNAFSRGFKTAARAPADLSDQVEAALSRRCLEILGLGKRAGALALGFYQVEAAIRQSPPFGLVEATDGAPDGREKLVRLTFGLWSQAPPIVGCFSAAELGMALGRDRVVHAGWLQERMARLWTVETNRLSGFRDLAPESWRLAHGVIPGNRGDAAERAPRE
ncbi:MAG: RNA-binding protein [Pseudomonadota bacterium]